MRTVATALDGLPEDVRARIVLWAASKYGVRGIDLGSRRFAVATGGGESVELFNSEHRTLAEFFDSLNPHTESQKVLIAGYWLQRYRGMTNFDSATVNRELKYLGRQVRNVTAAFDDLKQLKPALAAQVSKSGITQQARKQYTITSAGENAVLDMLASASDAEG